MRAGLSRLNSKATWTLGLLFLAATRDDRQRDRAEARWRGGVPAATESQEQEAECPRRFGIETAQSGSHRSNLRAGEEKTGHVGVPLSRFRDSLPSRHGRSARTSRLGVHSF